MESTAEPNGSVEHTNGSRVHSPEKDSGRQEEEDPLDTEALAKQYLAEVVMSHNDMLSGNVLHASEWNKVQVKGESDGMLPAPLMNSVGCVRRMESITL